jgi:hypothetical protein
MRRHLVIVNLPKDRGVVVDYFVSPTEQTAP